MIRTLVQSINKRSRVGISQILVTIILVLFIMIVGVIIFQILGPFISGKASLSVAVIGSGSPDGTEGSLQVKINNFGDGDARIVGIYVQPGTDIVTIASVVAPGIPADVDVSAIPRGGSPPVPASMPTTGSYLDLEGGKNRLVFLQLQGDNIRSGSRIVVYVVYFDIASGESEVVNATARLRRG